MMKNSLLSFIVLAMGLFSLPAFSQAENQAAKDTTLLGLPGDNLDLYAVLDLFQKSKTIEEFEKSLNLEATGVNNLDLNLDNKVDFIKVVTKQDGDNFTFILQDAVNEKETQDVAVILVSKDKDKKVTMQIVGDEDLYGKNYIVEPKTSVTPAVTPNPAYSGANPVTVSVPASTTTVVVESAPIVQYVYSPAYVPYYPPYYYGYYPPYFAAFSVMAVGMYWGFHAAYHYGGYGYHGNTTVIHNTNNFNNYNNSRNRSNTVNNNMANGNYNRNNASTRQSDASASNRQSGASASTRQSGASASTRQSGAAASTRQSGASASTRQSGASASTRQSTGTSTRPSSSNMSSSSRSSSAGASRTRSSGSYSGGGASRGGYSGGGASRGGFSGGGGGRRR
jgi:hypothetical protein